MKIDFNAAKNKKKKKNSAFKKYCCQVPVLTRIKEEYEFLMDNLTFRSHPLDSSVQLQNQFANDIFVLRKWRKPNFFFSSLISAAFVNRARVEYVRKMILHFEFLNIIWGTLPTRKYQRVPDFSLAFVYLQFVIVNLANLICNL